MNHRTLKVDIISGDILRETIKIPRPKSLTYCTSITTPKCGTSYRQIQSIMCLVLTNSNLFHVTLTTF